MEDASALSAFLPRGIRRGSLFLLSFAFALLFLMASSASATTWTVQTLGDSTTTTVCTDQCTTLRDAIFTAHDGDTIDFKTGLTGTITLKRSGGALDITTAVTITGPGANLLTISGQGEQEIFFITASSGTVKISGLTFEDGSEVANGNSGGAILDDGEGTLNVADCTFSGNSAGYGDGGAIYGGIPVTVTVTNSTFSGNSAAGSGGAIRGDGTVTVTNSTFSGNSAADNGGAIASAGTLTVTNSTFSANSAAGDGGAIAGGTLTATNNIFFGNSAGTDGAIDFEGAGNPTESYNLFYGNRIAGTGTESDANFTLDSTDLSSSTSGKKVNLDPSLASLGNYGGPTETMLPEPGSAAICAGDSGALTKALTSLKLPLTDQRGFPIAPTVGACANGNIDIGSVQTNYLLVTNTSNSSSTEGSLPYEVSIGEPESDETDQDYADIGLSPNLGSATIKLSSTLDLSEGSTVIVGLPGAVTISGGGTRQILNISGSSTFVSLYGLTFTGGSAHFGGAILNDGGTLIVSNSTFDNNQAKGIGSIGGAIDSNATLIVSNSTFDNNKANSAGGAIDNASTLTVTNSTFDGNQANGTGGAIDNGLGFTLIVSNSTFDNNKANSAGGAIYNDASTLTVTNSTFDNNKANATAGATAQGGAIRNGGTLTVTNSTFDGNQANNAGTYDKAQGGAMYSIDGTLTIADNIFTGNTATASGGGSTADGGGIYNYAGPGAGTVVDHGYNLFYDNYINTSTENDVSGFTLNPHDLSLTTSPNKNIDPMLAPLGNYGGPTETLLPQPGSAAICAAPPNLPSPLVLPTTDQRGFPRTTTCTIDSSPATRVDIGSVETNYQALTTELADYVDLLHSEGALSNGQTNSLLKELDKAVELAGEGDISGAINNINDYVSEVNDLYSSGVLTQQEANSLLGFSNVAMESLPPQ